MSGIKLRAEAWLLRGTSSLPGELTLMNGTLAYCSSGKL